MTVTGWPYRFVLDTKAPEIRAAQTNSAGQGERLELVAMSWNLFHIIARAPGQKYTPARWHKLHASPRTKKRQPA